MGQDARKKYSNPSERFLKPQLFTNQGDPGDIANPAIIGVISDKYGIQKRG
jgi:hypothetical protein